MKRAEDFLELPYHFVMTPDRWDDGTPGWLIEVAELPGCVSQGASPDEAVERIHDAMLSWIDVVLQDGAEIPLPYSDDADSGLVTLPIPAALERALGKEARRRGVHVDQLIVSLLNDVVASPAGTDR
jgi:antitoxin HicB